MAGTNLLGRVEKLEKQLAGLVPKACDECGGTLPWCAVAVTIKAGEDRRAAWPPCDTCGQPRDWATGAPLGQPGMGVRPHQVEVVVVQESRAGLLGLAAYRAREMGDEAAAVKLEASREQARKGEDPGGVGPWPAGAEELARRWLLYGSGCVSVAP